MRAIGFLGFPLIGLLAWGWYQIFILEHYPKSAYNSKEDQFYLDHNFSILNEMAVLSFGILPFLFNEVYRYTLGFQTFIEMYRIHQPDQLLKSFAMLELGLVSWILIKMVYFTLRYVFEARACHPCIVLMWMYLPIYGFLLKEGWKVVRTLG